MIDMQKRNFALASIPTYFKRLARRVQELAEIFAIRLSFPINVTVVSDFGRNIVFLPMRDYSTSDFIAILELLSHFPTLTACTCSSGKSVHGHHSTLSVGQWHRHGPIRSGNKVHSTYFIAEHKCRVHHLIRIVSRDYYGHNPWEGAT
jgi:hypothetical protein